VRKFEVGWGAGAMNRMQEAALDEQIESGTGDTWFGERVVPRTAATIAAGVDKRFLNPALHGHGVLDAAEGTGVEFAQDAFTAPGDMLGLEAIKPSGEPLLIQLSAEEAK
jgi:hypothetical protein